MKERLTEVEDRRILVSVVVCTYNRGALVGDALQSLVDQTLDRRMYEIIVVDNASSDGTSQIMRNFKEEHPEHHVVLTDEERVGLAHARNTGVRQARGLYVAFMDDDARANRTWLETGLRCICEVQPAPMGVGGKIIPVYNSAKPKWFQDEWETRSWGEWPRFLAKGESFSGSNMMFRKEVLEEFGGFDVRVGVKGPYLSVGEETAVFRKIWQARDDACFYYSPEMVVYHAVPAYKMTFSYPLKRAFVSGQVSSLQDRLRPILLARIAASIVIYAVMAFVPGRGLLSFSTWAVTRVAPIAGEIGRLLGCIGLFIQVKQENR
jgi:glucosyl-dolichyl phosphate glucuronosyltransferase